MVSGNEKRGRHIINMVMRNAHGAQIPKKMEETLDQRTDDRPFEKDEKDITGEAGGPAQLVSVREKVEWVCASYKWLG